MNNDTLYTIQLTLNAATADGGMASVRHTIHAHTKVEAYNKIVHCIERFAAMHDVPVMHVQSHTVWPTV